MFYYIGLQVLQAKIRGFQVAGSTISSRISKSEKQQKHKLWDSKRNLGHYCRYHLVAYGLLRGIPYERIEKCSIHNKLDPQVVLKLMLQHANWKQEKELNIEYVKSLLVTHEKHESVSGV